MKEQAKNKLYQENQENQLLDEDISQHADETLKEALVRISNAANEKSAKAMSDMMYLKMKEYMIRLAKTGEVKYRFDYTTFKELYDSIPNWYGQMIKMLKIKFKTEGLNLEYVEITRDEYIYIITIL